jgi:hypothetical protein
VCSSPEALASSIRRSNTSTRWGGWGSNPRPRDYECSRTVRCAQLHEYTSGWSVGRRILGSGAETSRRRTGEPTANRDVLACARSYWVTYWASATQAGRGHRSVQGDLTAGPMRPTKGKLDCPPRNSTGHRRRKDVTEQRIGREVGGQDVDHPGGVLRDRESDLVFNALGRAEVSKSRRSRGLVVALSSPDVGTEDLALE